MQRIAYEKLASALRSRLQLVRNPDADGMAGFTLQLGERPVATMVTDRPDIHNPVPPQVHLSNSDPSFRGMGIGNKLYGEMARQMPRGEFASDHLLSSDSMKVYRRLQQAPHYSVDAPNPYLPVGSSSISGMNQSVVAGEPIFPRVQITEKALTEPAPRTSAGIQLDSHPRFNDPTKQWDFLRDKKSPPIPAPAGTAVQDMTGPERRIALQERLQALRSRIESGAQQFAAREEAAVAPSAIQRAVQFLRNQLSRRL